MSVQPVQSVEFINAILEKETGWTVEEAEAQAGPFLRVYRHQAGERIFLTSVPREADVGTLCAMGMLARHYFQLGQATPKGARSGRRHS